MTHNCCIVTGGAGFIGCAISTQLADLFDRVVAIDSLHPQIHRKRIRPTRLDQRVQLLVEDILEREVWDKLLPDCRPEVVIHLAAETGTGQSLTAATRHSETNVSGTAVMLDALAGQTSLPRRFILSSSRAVYGEGRWRRADKTIFYPGQRTRQQLARHEWDFAGAQPLPLVASETEPRPVSIYGATKLAQEHMLNVWTEAFGAELVVLRLQNVYGPGQSLTNPYTGIVPFFSQLARDGKSIPLFEDGRMQRDFVYIDDVADAVMAAVQSAETVSGPFDIGTGRAATIHEVATLIAALYNSLPPHVSGEYRIGDVRHASCEVQGARDNLRWTASVNLNEGLSRLCSWLDGERVKSGVHVDKQL